jgi:hypothetical protein
VTANRWWKTPAVLVGLILAGGTIVALLAQRPAPAGYLDPVSTQGTGARALADILAERGTQVLRETTAGAAVQAARTGASAIVVTSPGLLTGRQLTALAGAPASLVVVGPDPAALAALAPEVSLVRAGTPVGPVRPGCSLAAARLAGGADLGGTGLRLAAGQPGVSCYPSAGLPSLVRYSAGARTITVLGTGTPLRNDEIARLGNAALALNLLAGNSRLAWLVPQPALAGPAPAQGTRSLWQLIPRGTYLVAAELGVALLLTALWRGRRLGPLITERMPVVVRAAETTEGHARLYQARRARGQAAAALRTATLGRLTPALGLPAAAGSGAIIAAFAGRSMMAGPQLTQLLFGPAPDSDAALVRLADNLDALEREVLAR